MTVEFNARCPHCGLKTVRWRLRSGNYMCSTCGRTSSRQVALQIGIDHQKEKEKGHQ
jgi:DNA-directed RNA polymerase subunit RPC12/RpoP